MSAIAATIGRRRLLTGLLAAVPLILARRSHANSGVPHRQSHRVEIRGMKFAPETLAVAAGDTITWTNADLAPHSATALDGSWDTGRLAKGESATIDVTDGMSGSYRCKYHPQMKAALTVG